MINQIELVLDRMPKYLAPLKPAPFGGAALIYVLTHPEEFFPREQEQEQEQQHEP
jgi:hypothetical protein